MEKLRELEREAAAKVTALELEKENARQLEKAAGAKAAALELENEVANKRVVDALNFAERAWQMNGRRGPPFLGF